MTEQYGRIDFDEAMRMSTLDEDGDHQETHGLDALYGFELELRKLSLAQIGYLFLTAIGEANHGSWDSVPRQELIGINNLFADLTYELKEVHPPEGPSWEPFTFGDNVSWDEQGNRLED